jgi:hypothetical protein
MHHQITEPPYFLFWRAFWCTPYCKHYFVFLYLIETVESTTFVGNNAQPVNQNFRMWLGLASLLTALAGGTLDQFRIGMSKSCGYRLLFLHN